MSGVWAQLRDGTLAVGDAAWNAANVETYRLAVTGLSRAGKTVLMVSLISNLLAMARGTEGTRWNTLPKLAARLSDGKGGSRLLGMEIEPTGTQRIPRFDYEGLRDQMASGEAPAWPPVTDRPALITLRLLLAPSSLIGKAKGLLLGPRLVRLELLDYPGEWLADLPLLEQGYEAWSAEVLADLRLPPRSGFAAPFLAFLETLQPDAAASEEVAAHGFRLYRDALRRCREEAGLRWLQPGRFLMPGPWGEVPLLHFFPWTGAPAPRRGTLGAQLRDRFDAYKTEIRTTFFEPYFSEFNRQLVLVDVLGALFAGKAAFEDARRSLHKIGDSYAKLLEGGWFGGRKIEAVAFAATKSDHVDEHQRSHLRLTLRNMVSAGQASVTEEARRSFHAVSAVRCTRDGDFTDADGRVQRAVFGVPLGANRERPFKPGTVPAGEVPESYWSNAYFVMPQLRPPAFRGGDAHPIENLNLDDILVALLGDAL
ncbi:YcjX family protein [Sediminicoccus sp. KRV36]|uniref:YcjX family protein n=1 Tax=Sediminicoccus sp. KRV36 TaxID=3133721 RepID=UPI00200BDA6D|nr:YcjX family protein [Sediminicoccus rosea]UPY38583.1 YcjX family protein [Sediminicoccus rosea]